MTPQHRTARCVEFAFHKHIKHVRKWSEQPYFVHLAEVAVLALDIAGGLGLSFSELDTVVQTAYLHDTIEDTDTVYSEVYEIAGPLVADAVQAMTDPPLSYGNRAARKQAKCAQIAAGSLAAQIVCAADMMSNARSIAVEDPNFYLVFRKEKDALINSLTLLPAGVHNRIRRLFDELDVKAETALLQKALAPKET
jgi:(p)ppGpp synthase/HD superfamily hydrolase